MQNAPLSVRLYTGVEPIAYQAFAQGNNGHFLIKLSKNVYLKYGMSGSVVVDQNGVPLAILLAVERPDSKKMPAEAYAVLSEEEKESRFPTSLGWCYPLCNLSWSFQNTPELQQYSMLYEGMQLCSCNLSPLCFPQPHETESSKTLEYSDSGTSGAATKVVCFDMVAYVVTNTNKSGYTEQHEDKLGLADIEPGGERSGGEGSRWRGRVEGRLQEALGWYGGRLAQSSEIGLRTMWPMVAMAVTEDIT